MLRVFGFGRIVLAFILTFTVCSLANAKEYRVSSANEIDAGLQAGDTIIMSNGVWNNQHIQFSATGSAAAPITLKAESAGNVVLTGTSTLRVLGSHVIVNGLLFKDGYLDSGHIVRFEGSHHRLTQSAIIDYNPESIDTRYFWVSLLGNNHRVDHNYFSGQNHSGVTTVVWLANQDTGFHQIDHNYYGQRPEGNGNGFETIRVGTGAFSHIDAHTVVEHNVFEETDGEIEIISNKSNKNIYRFNTFRKSSGTLTIRQGNQCIVENNFFLGEYKSGTGGVRVIGIDHMVVNNHFQQLAGRANGVISVSAGSGLASDAVFAAYPRVENSVIAGNLCVDSNGACLNLNANLGSRDRTILPEQLLVMNNVFHHALGSDPFIEGEPDITVTWLNNTAFGPSIGYDTGEGVAVNDLMFETNVDLIKRPSASLDLFSCENLSDALTTIEWSDVSKTEQLCANLSALQANTARPKNRNDVGPAWLLERRIQATLIPINFFLLENLE